MADQKEIFNILKDGSGDGEAPDLVVEDTASPDTKNGMVVYPYRKADGSTEMLDIRQETDPGGVVPHAVPSLAAVRDSDDTLRYLRLNNSGHLIVTTEGEKTFYTGQAEVTISTPGSEEQVLEVTIAAAVFNRAICVLSSFKDVKWNVYRVDDAGGGGEAETLLFRTRSGAGQYQAKIDIQGFNLDTSAGTGTQAIRVKATQRAGTGSDASAFLSMHQD